HAVLRPRLDAARTPTGGGLRARQPAQGRGQPGHPEPEPRARPARNGRVDPIGLRPGALTHRPKSLKTNAMNTEATMQLEDAVQLPTYAKMPIALVRGEGATVWDTEGNAYLDFYGGHCVALLGHCPPAVVRAVQQQAAELIFYSNAVYSPIRAAASKLLTDLAPDGLGHVFFCNSGAEANETALKLARTTSGKPGVIAMEGGFHGRTLGSLAATHNPKYRAPYTAVLPKT